jgi:SNF2 family DNA or RNA helicase
MFIANAQSMAHGLDGLQRGGRHIAWFDLTYSSELFTQANARLLRIGQERPTVVWRLMAKDSIDWAIAEALHTKDEQQRGLLAAVHALQQLRKQQ